LAAVNLIDSSAQFPHTVRWYVPHERPSRSQQHREIADPSSRCPLTFRAERQPDAAFMCRSGLLQRRTHRRCAGSAESRGALLVGVVATSLVDRPAAVGFPLIERARNGWGAAGRGFCSSHDGRRGHCAPILERHRLRCNSRAASSVNFDFDTAQARAGTDRSATGFAGRVYANERSDEMTSSSRCFRFRYEQACRILLRQRRAVEPAESLRCGGTLSARLRWTSELITLSFSCSRPAATAAACETFEAARLRRSAGMAASGDIEYLPPCGPSTGTASEASPEFTRRIPRLHHLRGHLVRRGPASFFWRVTPSAGQCALGIVRSLTFTGPRRSRPPATRPKATVRPGRRASHIYEGALLPRVHLRQLGSLRGCIQACKSQALDCPACVCVFAGTARSFGSTGAVPSVCARGRYDRA